MGGHRIREDNTCTNCGYVVALAYCPACGQHNTETRQSFGYLFTHFVEDFTHYDNAFWKTMKNLMFRPGQLSRTYLSGQRQKFVPPVKLYIFVSFVTFFILASLPSDIDEWEEVSGVSKEVTAVDPGANEEEGLAVLGGRRYRDLQHYDSEQLALPATHKDGTVKRYLTRNTLELRALKSPKDIIRGFKDAFIRNFPKALFFYLPVFAFWLWIFHSKKKWYFFDHAIFTLHYFAFMLLTFAVVMLLEEVYSLLPEDVEITLSNITGLISCGWIFIYFFIAHKRLYRESNVVSNVKSIGLFFINVLLMTILMTIFGILMLFSLQ